MMANVSLPAAKFAVPSSGSRVALDRLLANHRHGRQNLGQAARQALLGSQIGNSDEITRLLLPDVAFGEITEPRNELNGSGFPDQVGDPLRVPAAEHWLQPTTPKRSSSFKITWSSPLSLTSVPDHLP